MGGILYTSEEPDLKYVTRRLVIYSRICIGTRIRSRNLDTLLVTLLSKIRQFKSDTNLTVVDDHP